MSVAPFLDTLGAVAGGLGIIGFIMNLIPDAPEADGAAIRIKIGNPGDDDPGVGGQVSNVYSWDTFNNYLGKADGQTISAAGDVGDFVIDASSPGAHVDFVGVSADNDAVCIAWITVKQRDDSKGGAWTGDIGKECGQPWHYSGEKAGKLKNDDGSESDEDYIPSCTWLDADKTGGDESASMKFRIAAYGEKVTDTYDNAKGCDSTLWGSDDYPINDTPAKKRSLRARTPAVKNTLIVSGHPHQTAAELCNSATSWGNDFVGSDGMFCDMENHTLHPLCSTSNVDGCVDVDAEGNRLTRRSIGFKRAVDTTAKEYKSIKQWGN